MNNKNKYQQILSVILIIILLSTIFSNSVFANEKNEINQIIKTYKFNKPLIEKYIINNTTYDKISIKNTTNLGNPGDPNLPKYGVKILIPPKTEVKEIEIIPGEKKYLGSGYNIEPIGESIPISMINYSEILEQNITIYNSNEIIPKKLFTNFDTHFFRGYSILTLTLNPVTYNPYYGDLFYYKELTVNIKIIEIEKTNMLFRNLIKDENKLINKIDNPNEIGLYFKNFENIFTKNNYDLLIITSEELKNIFESLKHIHDSENIRTEIKTLNDISLFPSLITPEDIREFIKNEYINNGIEYVLIGGDDNIIPSKQLFLGKYNNINYYGPSDLYYACLDGTYNYDGDSKWGESTDGENGGDVDLIAEVYVGRACVNTTSEANNFVYKTKNFIESNNKSNTVLMVAEKLSSKPKTWGGDYLDEIINESNNSGFKTIGFSKKDYNIETLYERDMPNNNWETEDIINKINDGVSIINHLGHSSLEYSMKLHNYDIYSLTNDEPFFVYSQGCTSGAFDYDNCIAEEFTVKTNNGAFAGIWNARFGWYALGSTNGASHRFHREFWDAIFGENINTIGKANQDSKEDLLFTINYFTSRWVYYQLNLLGDPTLSFNNTINDPPNKPIKPIKEKTLDGYKFKTSSFDNEGDEIFYKWV